MLIADQQQLDLFTQNIMQPLANHECYMVLLYSRKKYGGQQHQYGRAVFKTNIHKALAQLWAEYQHGPTQPITSLAVYVSVNPMTNN